MMIKLIGLYFWNLLRSVDRFANAAILLRDPRESISSSAGKAANNGRMWACVLCRFLGWIKKNHCQDSIDTTVGNEGIIKD